MELGRDICSDILICVIQRGDEIYIPDGSFVMEEGDIISLWPPDPISVVS